MDKETEVTLIATMVVEDGTDYGISGKMSKELADKMALLFKEMREWQQMKEEDGEQKKIEINRYFREPVGEETGHWTEISEEEYMQRKQIKIVKGE